MALSKFLWHRWSVKYEHDGDTELFQIHMSASSSVMDAYRSAIVITAIFTCANTTPEAVPLGRFTAPTGVELRPISPFFREPTLLRTIIGGPTL
jgi:hypothetical protein